LLKFTKNLLFFDKYLSIFDLPYINKQIL